MPIVTGSEIGVPAPAAYHILLCPLPTCADDLDHVLEEAEADEDAAGLALLRHERQQADDELLEPQVGLVQGPLQPQGVTQRAEQAC